MTAPPTKSVWLLKAAGPVEALVAAAQGAWPSALVLAADPEQRLRAVMGRPPGSPAFDVVVMEPSPATGGGATVEALPEALAGAVERWGRVDVEEHERWDRLAVRPWPGPVQISFVVGVEGLAPGEVWRNHEEHTDIAREHHPAIARYVQDRVTATAGPAAPPAAAVSELWFESEADALARFYRDDASVAVVRQDISEYIDLRRSVTVFAGPA